MLRVLLLAIVLALAAGSARAQAEPGPVDAACAAAQDACVCAPICLGIGGCAVFLFLCTFDKDGWFGWACCGLVDGGPTGGRAVSTRAAPPPVPWRPTGQQAY